MQKWKIVMAAFSLIASAICAPIEAARANAAGITIAGDVKDALGRSIEGASIELQARDGRTVAKVTSDKTGKFEFKGVAPGMYAVMAKKSGFKTATSIATVSASSAKP